MFGLNKTWQLEARLKADTFPICNFGECSILLMNDQRWPWIIIVPQVPDCEELHELSNGQVDNLMTITSNAGENLKKFARAEKINTAALGNIVRQLHIHVVARSVGDPDWPAPVWGYENTERYPVAKGLALAEKLKEELFASSIS
ncbi:MAG: HIT family protein [Rhizobiaceae bacterium]